MASLANANHLCPVDGQLPEDLIVEASPTIRSESAEFEAQLPEFDSLYAAASSGRSFALLIKSHKMIAGSANVTAMPTNRYTTFS